MSIRSCPNAAAAAWGMLDDLGVAAIIDQVTVPRRSDAGASVGTYLALAALGCLVAPCSKLAFAGCGRARQPAGSPGSVRRHWITAGSGTRCSAVGLEELEEISRRIALAIGDASGVDCSSVAPDMTNFATFVDTGNERAPIAQRGKAKHEAHRPAPGRPGPGRHPRRRHPADLARLPWRQARRHPVPAMIDTLASRHEAICASGQVAADVTVVFDAGQNSAANFAHLAGTRLHYVGSVPDCAGLTGLPASARAVVDEDRFGGLTACDTRREVYGTERRTILTHSPELHAAQAAGFTGTTLAKAGRMLDELAATLARGKTRRSRAKVEAEIGKILHDTWARRVITWQLARDTPKDHQLTWRIDPGARAALEEEIFGKHVLITDHDDWPAAGVVAGYRSQSEAEASFRQMKDPRVASFSPMFHWTEHNIRVHVFTCVLALQLAHLMRRRVAQAGLDLSVRVLLAELAGIGETVLLYPASGAAPGPTECSPTPPIAGQAHQDLRARPLRTQTLTWVIHRKTPAPELVGSPGASQPPAPTDPGVNLSVHRALVILVTRRAGPKEPISSARTCGGIFG